MFWLFFILKSLTERDCFQPIKWQENQKSSLCSRKFAHWAKRLFLNFLSKETVFEFPTIWLVENSLFLWDFFKMKKSQNIRNRPLVLSKHFIEFLTKVEFVMLSIYKQMPSHKIAELYMMSVCLTYWHKCDNVK